MLQPWLFVGFVGHRKLARPELISAGIHAALDRIAASSPGPLAAVSSVASGADTLFVEAALARGLPWTLLLPFPIAEFRVDFTPEEWARAECLLPRAVRTHVEPRADNRDDLFLECAVRTIEESDVVVAVWDGQAARGKGGTGDGVAHARALKKPLLWVHAVSGELMAAENLERLAVDDTRKPEPDAPPSTLNTDTLDATLAHYDRLATRHQPRAANLTLSLIVLYQSATLVAIAGLIWTDTAWLLRSTPWLKLGILVLALWLPVLLRRSHGGWMRHRLLAELCRSARAIWSLRDPEEVFAAIRLPVETGLQRSLALLRHVAPPAPADLAAAKADYLSHRIDHQLAYFERLEKTASLHRRRLRRFATVCTLGAIALGVSLSALLRPGDAAYAPLKFLALTLPLLASALFASLAALDLERRAARSREMSALLAQARLRASVAATWSGLRRVVIEVERSLLLEIWEWFSLQRFAARR